jgi:hypothetical protein
MAQIGWESEGKKTAMQTFDYDMTVFAKSRALHREG